MKIIPLLLALGLAVGGFVVPTVPAAPEVGAVNVVAAPASGGVLRPDEALLVSGTVTNSTAQPLNALVATLYVSSSRMVTRAAMADWLAGESSFADSRRGDALGQVQIPELGVGQTRTFSLAVPPGSLAFMLGETGAFPFEVHVTAGGVAVASQHGAVTWVPDGFVPRVNLAVATPLNAPRSSTGLVDAETLEALTAPNGQLYNQLQMAMLHTVALGVDPMIVASIRLLGDSAPQSARDWLEQLEDAPNDVFTLSYADSDQLLLHQAGIKEPLTPLSFPEAENVAPTPQETPEQEGSTPAATSDADTEPVPGDPVTMRTTIDGLAWPARALESEDGLDFLRDGGFTRTLLSSSEVSRNSVATPNATVGKHHVTVSDDQVSMLLRAAAEAPSDVEWAAAVANLAATLAVAAAQNPGSTVVATFARVVSPNARLMGNTLNTIKALPWVNSTTLKNALNAAPVSGSVTDRLKDDADDSDHLLLTKELISSENTLTEFSSVADDPTKVTGPQRLSLLALVSAIWAGDSSGWDAAARQHLADNEAMLASIHIPEGSFINFPLEKGNLPITVRNELSFPVTVYVTARAERAILKITDPWVELKIEANSQTKVFIPVESIANGEVLTTVSISSATGVQVSKPTIVTLNVQAGWETTATVVLAVIVLLLFGAGIWRTILRRRSLRASGETREQVTS